jgi:hypothetical protein
VGLPSLFLKKNYDLAFRNFPTPITFAWLWKSRCIPRIKFFGWLLLVDKLNTRSMLRRRNFHLDDGYLFVMCPLGAEQDALHLFFDCPFAKTCWQALHFNWTEDNDLHAKIISGRTQNTLPFFMEIFLVATWEIWKLRNDKIFNRRMFSRSQWIFNFKK